MFLDIETTGLSHYYDEVTLVGLYDGKTVTTLLSGHNLHLLPEMLERYQVLVTFNGTLFDIPFLKTKFRALRLPQIHLDLRYLLRRIGYAGGLKEIERKLGIRREAQAAMVDGLMAPVLWARYLRGDVGSLEKLVKYNTADITSLQSLMRYCYEQLALRLLRRHAYGLPRPHATQPRRIYVGVRRLNQSTVKLVVDRAGIVLQLPPREEPPLGIEKLLAKLSSRPGPPKIVGIDLRASEARPTGWALLHGTAAETRLLRADEEIIQETISSKPDVISIDSPLTLPAQRCCTKDSCSCRAYGITRECERALWKRGVRVFPCLLPSMQKLTERGIQLAAAFRRLGYTVIESYPGGAQDIMRIPRKKSSLEDLSMGLAAFGLHGRFRASQTTHDELDAITSAVVGYFYLTGDYEALGNEGEDYLIIPRVDRLISA